MAPSVIAFVALASVSEAAFVLVPRGGTVDVDSDGTADLMVEMCNDCGALPNRIVHLNSSFRGFSGRSYALSDCTDVAAASFLSNGPFLPSSGDAVLVKSNSNGFGKLQHNDVSTTEGMELEWQALGCTPVSPPDTDFTFTTYDILAFFTDTSTNDPATSWSWTFGDAGTSTAQNPSHAYAAGGTYNVCLTASNVGGAGSTTCKDVTVATVPSTTVPVGSSIDFDGDSVDDLQVLATTACGGTPNMLKPLDPVNWTSVTMDYRTVTIDNAPTPASTSDFCHPVADLFETGIVQASNGSIVKFWTPQNTGGGGIRFEFAVLLNTVSPPDTDFTSTTYDLLAFFTDTSASDPATSWSWTFGDAGTSTAQNPSHAYAAGGTYNVCLTASNVGGTGSTTCKDVTVATVPSTTAPPGSSIDFDGDSVDDLQVLATAACSGGVPNILRPSGTARWASITKDYRTVTLGDAPTPLNTSDFCHAVADVFETGIVKGSKGSIVKFWTPQNDAGGVRFEFAILMAADPSFALFTLDPCRLIDTRNPGGELGGPALSAQSDRAFAVTGTCGIPSTAKALAVNLTILGATSAGHLRLHPAGTAPPPSSTINYDVGQVRANNAVVALSGSGEIAAYVGQPSGSVHLVLDVAGYFE